MDNEATRAFTHFFHREEGNEIHFLGADTGVSLFVDIFDNGEHFVGDAPDMVIRKDSVAIIIEHFEFDCFRVTRKGSSSRMEQARIDRAQRQLPATREGTVFHDKIRANCSYNDYITNVTRNFNEHYARIADYKRHLVEKGLIGKDTVVKVMFLIEDVSPIGTIAIDEQSKDRNMVPVVLAQCPEFLQLLSQCNDLDYVLCCSSAGSNEYVWFIDRQELAAYEEKACDYAHMRFLFHQPSVMGVKMVVPDDELTAYTATD